MTFSLRPTRSSTEPVIAASVSTRVVSWKEAAEMKLSVVSDALVMPSRMGFAMAGCPPRAITASFSRAKVNRSTCSPIRNGASPASSILTLRNIWRTMTSMCLSLMLTPCRR